MAYKSDGCRRWPGWTNVNVFVDGLILFGCVPAEAVRPPPKISKLSDAYGEGGLGLEGVAH